jgi:hypothetical protein
MEILTIEPPSQTDYRLPAGTRLFLILFTAVLVAGTFWGVVYFILQALGQQSLSPLIIIVPGLGYAYFFAYGAWSTARSRLLIDATSIHVVAAFSTKSLLLTDIAGYRTDEKWIYIHSISQPKQRLQLSRFVSNLDALHQWLETYFFNLDLSQNYQEWHSLREDPALGRSLEEREQKLREARLVARVLNVAGVALSIWLFILGEFRQYYELSIALGILFPCCLVGVLWFYRGLIGLQDKKEGTATAENPVPSLMTALLFPPLILAFRSFFDYDVLDYGPIWAAAACLGFLLALALYLGTYALKHIKSSRYGLYATIMVSSLAWGYGTAFLTNGLYDTATPTHHQARVLDMRTTKGKINRYYLTLTPWGPLKEPEEIKVLGQYYKQLSVGDTVQLQLHPGWLKAPWYKVEEHR